MNVPDITKLLIFFSIIPVGKLLVAELGGLACGGGGFSGTSTTLTRRGALPMKRLLGLPFNSRQQRSIWVSLWPWAGGRVAGTAGSGGARTVAGGRPDAPEAGGRLSDGGRVSGDGQ